MMAISRMVMMALPTITNGLRARSDRLGGGGTCSGSSAARGLRGEMGGLSLIDATWILPVQSYARTLGVIAECGETVESHASNALIGRTLYHKRGVGASKTERVRQRHIDLAPARLLRDEVDRRLDRRIVEIDGRRRDVVADRQDAENRLDRPGRAKQMAGRRL